MIKEIKILHNKHTSISRSLKIMYLAEPPTAEKLTKFEFKYCKILIKCYERFIKVYIHKL